VDNSQNNEPQTLSFLLTKVSRVVIRMCEKELMPLGITLPRSVALRTLLQHGPMTQSALGTLLLVDKATVSTVINQLRRDHLVETTGVPQDARVVLLILTEQGKVLAEQVLTVDLRVEAYLEQEASPTMLKHVREYLTGVLQRGRQDYWE